MASVAAKSKGRKHETRSRPATPNEPFIAVVAHSASHIMFALWLLTPCLLFSYVSLLPHSQQYSSERDPTGLRYTRYLFTFRH
jgi:hypothetical protein